MTSAGLIPTRLTPSLSESPMPRHPCCRTALYIDFRRPQVDAIPAHQVLEHEVRLLPRHAVRLGVVEEVVHPARLVQSPNLSNIFRQTSLQGTLARSVRKPAGTVIGPILVSRVIGSRRIQRPSPCPGGRRSRARSCEPLRPARHRDAGHGASRAARRCGSSQTCPGGSCTPSATICRPTRRQASGLGSG